MERWEADLLQKDGAGVLNGVYIGRGSKRRGVPGSKWGNPFKIGQDGSRSDVVSKFREYIAKSALMNELEELKAKTILCHCEPTEECHGDVLVELVKNRDTVPMRDFVDDGLPTHLEVDPEWSSMPASSDNADPLVNPGWRGRGAPRQAPFMGREKAYADGGGLCSLGRWGPAARRHPQDFAKPVREGAWAVLERAALRGQGGKGSALQLMLRLALGRVTESPFTEEDEVEVRELVKKAFVIEEKECGVSPRQCMRLGMISAMLHRFGDPDWQFVKELEDGVPLGVDEELPRTPAVFEEKVKWSLDEDDGPGESERNNYSSVEPHLEEVESLFREEAKEGWMVEMTDQDAFCRFGDRLHVASLAVVAEKDKIRVVHDASSGVHVNNRIKVRDQLRCPGAGEMKYLMRERRENQLRS